MTYSKPELLAFSAIATIQTGQNQKTGLNNEPSPQQNKLTPAAYEADE